MPASAPVQRSPSGKKNTVSKRGSSTLEEEWVAGGEQDLFFHMPEVSCDLTFVIQGLLSQNFQA